MKVNTIYFILIPVLLSSCLKNKKANFHYPNRKKFEQVSNKDTLMISSFFSFKELKYKAWKYHSENPHKNIVYSTEDKNNKYFIKPIATPTCSPNLYRLKNLILISKDSVYKSEKYYVIDSLETILKTDLLNYGVQKNYSDNPESLTILFLHPEEESIIDFNNNLVNLFTTYNKIKLETKDNRLQLNIEFQEFLIPKAPPVIKDFPFDI